MKTCAMKFFKVLGAAVGALCAAEYIPGAYSSDWKSFAYVLFGLCVGMVVGWIVSLGMSDEDGKKKKKK